jgi:hypothetical protein
MNSFFIACLSILWFMTILTSGLAQEPEQYTLLKFHIDTKEQIKELSDLGISLDSGPMRDNSLEVIVNHKELDELRKTSLKYEVRIDDWAKYYQENIKKSPAELQALQSKMNEQYTVEGFELGSMGGYYTYDQIVSELDSMHHLYPDLVSEKSSLGLSIEGRDIWHIKISDHPDQDENETQILYTALHHAREPQGMATVIYFMYYLLENYGKDPQINYIIENRELHFIPIVNPDGYFYNQITSPGGGGMWRKNRRLNVDESYGVDLNRNYGYKWGYDDIGSSPDPTNWGFRGTEPFSEPETRAVRDFCENNTIRLCLNYHTYGNILIHPWNYADLVTPDSILYRELASSMTEINNYRYGTGGGTLGYIFNGCTTDWMYGEQSTKNKIIAMTPEVGPSFWPDASQVYPLAQENLQANILLAFGDGVITDIYSPHISSLTAGTTYESAGIDSILLLAEISNPQHNELSVTTYIDNDSRTYSDTIRLYNDGTHGDLIAGDSVFSCRIISPSVEDIFNLYGYLQSKDGQTHFYSALANFTTIGPLKVDSFVFTSEDSIPNPGDHISVLPLLKNHGNLSSAINVTIETDNLDSCNLTGYFSAPNYGDIGPGDISEPNQELYILFGEDCPDSVYTRIKVDILSGTSVFWSDTLTFFVHKDPLGGIVRKEFTLRQFKLEQNYPNPFNPTTIINYELPITNDVELSIYNLLGQKVAMLINEQKDAGYHQVEWDASGFASGIYYYRIQAGEFVSVKKMVLLR